METETYQIDRTGWASGPWDGEPDKVSWKDQATGLPCLAVRAHGSGAWCGYAAVPPGHVLHGLAYHDIEFDDRCTGVHGGLTYSNACHGGICHVPDPGDPDDVWWFGFDCAHGWDRQPAMEALLGRLQMQPCMGGGRTYKDLAFVRREVTQLAAQLADARPRQLLP